MGYICTKHQYVRGTWTWVRFRVFILQYTTLADTRKLGQGLFSRVLDVTIGSFVHADWLVELGFACIYCCTFLRRTRGSGIWGRGRVYWRQCTILAYTRFIDLDKISRALDTPKNCCVHADEALGEEFACIYSSLHP